MSDYLNEAEIVHIAQILSDDLGAVEKKEQIYGFLGLPLPELEDLKKRVFLDNSGHFGFFRTTLTKYVGRNGSAATVTSLIKVFTELKLVSVEEKLGKKSTATGIWFEVDLPVESFSGREKELVDLHELITHNTEKVTVINQISTVAGLGGVGKSELARKYACTYQEYYAGNVIWINAETEDSFQNSFIRLLVNRLAKSEDQCRRQKSHELLKIVYDYFGTQGRVLIVFDNVEAYDVLKLLPKSLDSPTAKIPNILITSRKCVWKTGIKILELDVWTVEEAIKFVNDFIARNVNQEDVVHLVNTLQRLPLALQQAVAFIRAELTEDSNPIQKYIKLFQNEGSQNLLDYINEDLSEHEKTTFKIWTLTLERIHTKAIIGGLGIRIMNIICFFEPDNIPGRIFNDQFKFQGASFDSSKLLTNSFLNEDGVNRAITLLKSYSMISGPQGIIHVHRLVQKVVGLSISQSHRQDVISDGLHLLEQQFYIKSSRSSNLELAQSLLQHAGTVWGYARGYPEIVNKYKNFPSNINWKLEDKLECRYREAKDCDNLKNYTDSLKILREIYPLAITEFGACHWITRDTCTLISKILCVKEDNREMLKILDDMIELPMRKYGPEHVKTRFAVRNKADALRLLGKLNESIEVHKSIYDLQSRLWGEEDPNPRNTLGEIASILVQKGDDAEAIKIYEQLTRSSGHKEPAIEKDWIKKKAEVLCRLGQYDQALATYRYRENESSMRSTVKDLRSLNTMWSIASVLEKKNDYEEALQIHDEITYIISSQELGQEHPTSMRAVEKKAGFLARIGKFDEALKELRVLLEIKNRAYNGFEIGLKILKTRSSIAWVLMKKEEYNEALATYQSVYEEHIKYNELDSPKALEIQKNIEICKSKVEER